MATLNQSIRRRFGHITGAKGRDKTNIQKAKRWKREIAQFYKRTTNQHSQFLKLTNFDLTNAKELKSLSVYEFYEHYEAMTEETERRKKDEKNNRNITENIIT